MTQVLNLLLGGVFHAAALFLVAAGLQLVFGVQKILNLACGSFYALGAYAGITAVKTLSDFREKSFGQHYGVAITGGPLAGVNARAVFVVGKDGKVKHVEYVKEIGSEPNYEAALAAAKSAAS